MMRILKNVLISTIPFIVLLKLRKKETRKNIILDCKYIWDVLCNDIGWTLKLYSLNFTLPLSLTIIYLLMGGVLGIEFGDPFSFSQIGELWRFYFYDGQIGLGISMWRVHIFLLVFSFIFYKISDKG